MKSIISICNLNNNYQKSIKESLNQIRWTNIVKKDDSVALKINLATPEDKIGVTIRPKLLKQLSETLQSRCSELYICESDGSNFSCEDAFRNCRIYEITKETGTVPINLSKGPFLNYKFKNFKVSKLKLPKLLFECDHLFTLAVLKTHIYTTVSLGLKNQFGCIPSAKRFLYHTILDDMIVKLNQIITPTITIIDGIYGLNYHGPITGIPIKMNCLITSNNVVAADYVGSFIMGFNPNDIPHIQKAIKSKIGNFYLQNSRVHGDYKKFINHFQIRRSLIDKLSLLTLKSNFFNQLILNTPYIQLIRALLTPLSKTSTPNY